jgi:hypothetical protein
MGSTVFQLKAKSGSLNGIQQGRKGTPLAQTPRGLEKISCSSIYQGGDPGRAYTIFNPRENSRFKSKSSHYLKQKGMSYPIKGVSQI